MLTWESNPGPPGSQPIYTATKPRRQQFKIKHHLMKGFCITYRHGKGYNREYLKKKKQKKQQRFKQIEEERESEKNKWLSFHSKASKKPGVRTKSIFASPDNLTGRVGIGTCGISGKPMTEYTPGEKWKKGGG